MTDLEIIRDLLTRRKIAFVEHEERNEFEGYNHSKLKDYTRIIRIGDESGIKRSPENIKHCGYWRFYPEFYFDKDGALLNIGVWE